ncbi:MAG TPA: creatininase family protein [Longimicrobiaceae bacterium]|nr:creatininase family protein [Longimicrobiaceae bacterium]
MRSYVLSELTWPDVVSYLERDRRLILPVGACDQHGIHLPIGATTCIAERLADDLAQEFGVVRAPTFHYGVNVPSESAYAGTATLRHKTLHRVLNELINSWEEDGFTEIVMITASEHDPQIEAMATVYARRARVRVVEALSVDLSEYLNGPPGPQHGGETVTSLLLYLRPEAVRMEAARDFEMDPERFRKYVRGDLLSLPAGCPGSIGYPTLASAETGRRIYEFILDRIRQKVFISPPDDAQ